MIRTGIVGCGKVGHIHAAALTTLPESRFVAACDADAARAEAFAARYGARAYGDVESMLRESGVEALAICTPHPLHAASAVAAAERGVHLLIEKPLAASLADCDAILDAVRRGGGKLSVVSQRRWFEPVLRMKKAIDAGRIGRPALASVVMLSWRDEAYYRSDPWRGRWDTEGGGVLVNQAPHHLDLLRWLMGPIEEVSGYWANVNHPYVEVEDTALATVRFAGGGLASVMVSLSQKPGIHTKIHVHGSSGASVGVQTDGGATFVAGMSGMLDAPYNDLWTIPGEEALLAGWQDEDRARFASFDPVNEYHARQIRDFLRAIEEDHPPAVTGEDGRAVVEFFTAIYRSNQERRPVRFPLALS